MNQKRIIQNSIDIITEYYRNHLDPFFAALSDDMLWIGPRQGQVLRGKHNILKAWSNEKTDLRFSLGAISVQSISTGRNNLEVLLEYNVYTHFPDGETDKHHQRMHLAWGYRREVIDGASTILPRLCMINISNVISGLNEQNKIYATSRSESSLDAFHEELPEISSRTIFVHDSSGSSYFLNLSDIIWVESTDSGRHSIIHSLHGAYKSTERLRSIENQYSDFLLRCHTSYLINPSYVQTIKRFCVTMTDHSEIPIPEKKYTALRAMLKERLGTQDSNR